MSAVSIAGVDQPDLVGKTDPFSKRLLLVPVS